MLTGKTAVVTGGASGIGRATAIAAATHGADVVVADEREEPRDGGPPTASVIEADTDAQARFIDCDVAQRSDIAAAVDAADTFGGLDLMVNNAGILIGEDFDLSGSDYEDLLAVNFTGVFEGTRVAGNRMAANGGGSIVNVSSIEGIRAVSARPFYSATRRAVDTMSYAFAGLYGEDDVRVNSVAPGAIDTVLTREDANVDGERRAALQESVPLGRLGRAREIGDVVAFLGSDMASYLTGETILVDGGITNVAH